MPKLPPSSATRDLPSADGPRGDRLSKVLFPRPKVPLQISFFCERTKEAHGGLFHPTQHFRARCSNGGYDEKTGAWGKEVLSGEDVKPRSARLRVRGARRQEWALGRSKSHAAKGGGVQNVLLSELAVAGYQGRDAHMQC